MSDYLKYVEKLAQNNESSGDQEEKSYVYFTQLSAKRMKRWKKTGVLLDETKAVLDSLKSPQKWVVLTESWCGDAAHAYMFFQKMADYSDHITLEWKLRDEHPELMEQHLTNGSKSIPKLIVYDQDGKELFDWGPRPAHIQQAFIDFNKQGNLTKPDISIEIQKMYNKDKGESTQREICKLLAKAV